MFLYVSVATINWAICVHNVTRKAYIAEIQNKIENNQYHTEIRNTIKNVVNYNRSSLAAIDIQNKFMDYFKSENGSVYWQDKYLV